MLALFAVGASPPVSMCSTGAPLSLLPGSIFGPPLASLPCRVGWRTCRPRRRSSALLWSCCTRLRTSLARSLAALLFPGRRAVASLRVPPWPFLQRPAPRLIFMLILRRSLLALLGWRPLRAGPLPTLLLVPLVRPSMDPPWALLLSPSFPARCRLLWASPDLFPPWLRPVNRTLPFCGWWAAVIRGSGPCLVPLRALSVRMAPNPHFHVRHLPGSLPRGCSPYRRPLPLGS